MVVKLKKPLDFDGGFRFALPTLRFIAFKEL